MNILGFLGAEDVLIQGCDLDTFVDHTGGIGQLLRLRGRDYVGFQTIPSASDFGALVVAVTASSDLRTQLSLLKAPAYENLTTRIAGLESKTYNFSWITRR